jgi:hypothetical protein
MDLNSNVDKFIGLIVLTILAFTWFFPTMNGATGLNNSSNLWLGGTNYTWAVPLVAVLVIIGLVRK